MIQSFIECFQHEQLRGPHRLLTLACVCLRVCEVHVHVVCEVCVLRGQLLQCRSLEELWKKEVMSFALFHSFSGGREQRKTAALAVKMEEVDVCMCEGGGNNFLQSFWLFPRAIFGPTHVILMISFSFLFFFLNQLKKIHNGLCCVWQQSLLTVGKKLGKYLKHQLH